MLRKVTQEFCRTLTRSDGVIAQHHAIGEHGFRFNGTLRNDWMDVYRGVRGYCRDRNELCRWWMSQERAFSGSANGSAVWKNGSFIPLGFDGVASKGFITRTATSSGRSYLMNKEKFSVARKIMQNAGVLPCGSLQFVARPYFSMPKGRTSSIAETVWSIKPKTNRINSNAVQSRKVGGSRILHGGSGLQCRRWLADNAHGKGLASSLENSARGMVDALKRPSSLQRAASLHLESFWQRHKIKILLGGFVLVMYWVWRGMRATAAKFVDISDSLAATGIFALSASLSIFAAAFFYRRYFTINPTAAYSMAMMKLNSHPGVLEILGAPVVGSTARASVITGGGIKFKNPLKPKLRSRRVQMIFPLRGTERRGLVSLEAKKRKGKLKLSLLAVDVPMPAALGGEQRVYIEGGPKAYARGGVLDELRRPFLAAMETSDQADDADDAEEEEENRRKSIEESLM